MPVDEVARTKKTNFYVTSTLGSNCSVPKVSYNFHYLSFCFDFPVHAFNITINEFLNIILAPSHRLEVNSKIEEIS